MICKNKNSVFVKEINEEKVLLADHFWLGNITKGGVIEMLCAIAKHG